MVVFKDIKFFLVYLGVFFVIAVTLLVLVKPLSESMASSGKKPTVYSIVSAIIVSLIAYVSKFVSDYTFATYWIISGIFLLFGLIHVRLIHKKYFSPGVESNKVFFGEILFGFSVIFFVIVIFSSLQYFLSGDKEYLFYPQHDNLWNQG